MLNLYDTALHISGLNTTKVSNNTETNYYKQRIIVKSTIEANNQETKDNKQDSDEKMTKFTEEFKTMLAKIID